VNAYTILLSPDEDGGYTVTSPSLPGVVTHGNTVDEALAMARDAIAVFLEMPPSQSRKLRASRVYSISFEPDLESGGFTVTLPALPGCITDGDTIEEAALRAREAIDLYLDGEDISRFVDTFRNPTNVIALITST
jgi:antitoxin HicB